MISLNGISIIISASAALVSGIYLHFYLKRKRINKKGSLNKILFYELFKTPNIVPAISILIFSLVYGISQYQLRPYYQKWYLISEINENPLIPTIEKLYPNEYKLLLNTVEKSIKHNESSKKIVDYGYQFANHIFLISLKNASDEAIHQYIISIIELYQLLYQKNPDLILEFEYSDPAFGINIQYLSDEPHFYEKLDAVLNSKRNIIKESKQHPSIPIDMNATLPLFAELMNKLDVKYGKETVSAAFNPNVIDVRPDKKGLIIIDFYHVLKLSDKKIAGQIMRYIGALSENQ